MFQLYNPFGRVSFIEPHVHAVLGQAGPFGEFAHIIPLWDGVTVCVGVAEENFEGAFVVNGLHNGCTDLKQILRLREVCQL